MGIAPYKTFTFDGESSADYDVYLTGVGVFDSPERDVEMIEILGRNGNFALDRGRFRNVSVKYKIGMYDLTEANFATKVSAFRNWLCSKVGYVRLSDDYNPNEYRMAVYASGFEFKHDFLIAGEAEITFDCKPQRWLTSGETATAVADGGTLTNPTLFEASPLLEVKGYGSIDLGGQSIDIENVVIGNVILNDGNYNFAWYSTKTFDTSMFSNGDNIRATLGHVFSYINNSEYRVTSISIGTRTNCTTTVQSGNNRTDILVVCDTITYAKNTSYIASCSISYTVTVEKISDHSTAQTTINVGVTFSYDGDGTIQIATGNYFVQNISDTGAFIWGTIEGDSTKTALGNPMYIDLDIGEAWNEDSGTPVSVNNAVTFGSDLPKLPTGTTTITYDNTITSLKVAPRWWQV